MKYLDVFFAYIFFRINQLWIKIGYNNPSHVTSIIALLQTVLLFDLWLVLYTNFFTTVQDYKMPNTIYFSFIVLYILLSILNYFKYSKKYYTYLGKWGKENEKVRLIKGIILFLFVVLIPFTGAIYLELMN